MSKPETLPWRDPQPRPVGYEGRPHWNAYKGRSFRLVLEPLEGPRYSVVAVIAFLVALGVLVAVLAIKATSLLIDTSGVALVNPYDGIASTIVLGALALVAIVLGHIGLRQVHIGVRRGLVMSGFTLGAGYTLVLAEALAVVADL